MVKFAYNRYTLGKIRLGKQTLGNFTSGNLSLGNFSLVYLPDIILPKIFLALVMVYKKYDCYYSELNSNSCVKVLYTKKTNSQQKAYIQDKKKITPVQKLYTGMPVTPVTNSRSAFLMLHDDF